MVNDVVFDVVVGSLTDGGFTFLPLDALQLHQY